jgi:hypothetical protein
MSVLTDFSRKLTQSLPRMTMITLPGLRLYTMYVPFRTSWRACVPQTFVGITLRHCRGICSGLEPLSFFIFRALYDSHRVASNLASTGYPNSSAVCSKHIWICPPNAWDEVSYPTSCPPTFNENIGRTNLLTHWQVQYRTIFSSRLL